MLRHIKASAPTRIDFGGGTLDFFPLYLFFDNPKTINVAIDLGAEVTLTSREDHRVTIQSIDTNNALEVDGGVQALPLDGPLALISRVLRYYQVEGGIDVVTKMLPPHGSGLGSSSSLFITLAHAVLAYQNKPRDPEQIIRVCNALEAQLMGMPAGLQDYYPATYGGINCIHLDLEGVWVEHMDTDGTFINELQKYVVLSYTNITHHSGTTNWGKLRNFFDRVPRTVDSLHNIERTAQHFYQAFKDHDFQKIGLLLREEWENRKGLSHAVTSPKIDRMIEATYAAGSWGSKLCGAGGGGCMICLAPPECHDAIRAALTKHGASPLDVHLVREGVKIETS